MSLFDAHTIDNEAASSWRRLAIGLVVVLALQLLFGAALHYHRLGEHGALGNQAVHADFSHEHHADQSDFSPDQLLREQAGDDLPALVTVNWPVPVPALEAVVLPRLELARAPQPPPRYALPQPRDPPRPLA